MEHKVTAKTEKCPECGVSWDAGSIVETFRQQRDNGEKWLGGWSDERIEEYVKMAYAPPYRWSRLIGIEDPKIYDGISWWKCPECKTMWDRWTGKVCKPKKRKK